MVFDCFVGVKRGQWVLGGGWNNEKWGGELPSASWIDSFTKDIPVRFKILCGSETPTLFSSLFLLGYQHGY